MRIKSILLATLLSISLSISSFAGTWQGSDAAGWTYLDDSGNMVKNQWVQGSSGLWYYLGADGVMLRDTTTPDGYYVGSDGAWIENSSTTAQSVSIDVITEDMRNRFTPLNNSNVQYKDFQSLSEDSISFTINFLGEYLPDSYARALIQTVKESSYDNLCKNIVDTYSNYYNKPLFIIVRYAYNGIDYVYERGYYLSDDYMASKVQ